MRVLVHIWKWRLRANPDDSNAELILVNCLTKTR